MEAGWEEGEGGRSTAELQRASSGPAERREVGLVWNMQGITVIHQKSLKV